MPKQQRTRQGIIPQLSRGASDEEFRSRLVDEQRVLSRVACLTTNPCLDGIETLGSLMDIIEIGDIAEGAEQLNQALGSIPNDAPWRQTPTGPLIRAIAR